MKCRDSWSGVCERASVDSGTAPDKQNYVKLHVCIYRCMVQDSELGSENPTLVIETVSGSWQENIS